MKIETKLHAVIDGDQWIDKPSCELEVASEKEAALAAVSYGSRRFSLYTVDVVTTPAGDVLKGEKKNHVSCLLVGAPPLQRDDAIAHYAQRLADAFAQVASIARDHNVEHLEESVDYLKLQSPESFFICESIAVNRPEWPGTKYFDYNGDLLLTLPQPSISSPSTPAP
jgi:hypothetical protein